MADPVFDEDAILGLLASPPTKEFCDNLQSGAVQAFIDLFDRKVTREEFCDAIAPCFALYGQASRMTCLHDIEIVYKDGTLDQSKFDTADRQMQEIMRRQSLKVAEIVKRLMLCPSSAEPIQ